MSGYFSALEGIDGSGKSAAIELVAERARAAGRDLLVTHEPTSGPVGKQIYDILLGRRSMLPPLEFQRLYVLDRKEHVERVIWPALAAGQLVLCDRYWLSTLAYGMLTDSIEKLIALHDDVFGAKFLKPNRTFLFDLPAKVAIARLTRAAGNRLDYFEKIERLEKIRENYRAAAAASDETIVTIDAMQPPEVTAEKIWNAISTN